MCAGKRFSAICAMVLAIILYQGASVAITQLHPPASAELRFGLMCGVLALLAATIFLIPLGSGAHCRAPAIPVSVFITQPAPGLRLSLM